MARHSCSLLLLAISSAVLCCSTAQGATGYQSDPMSVPLRVPVYQGSPAGPLAPAPVSPHHGPPFAARMAPVAPVPNSPNPHLGYGCTPPPRKVFDPVSAVFSAITLPVKLLSRIVYGSPAPIPQVGPPHGYVPMQPPGITPAHPQRMYGQKAQHAPRPNRAPGPMGY